MAFSTDRVRSSAMAGTGEAIARAALDVAERFQDGATMWCVSPKSI